MAARLLHSLADENPDLQKQIGCMKGILQLFDRQHIRIAGHSPEGLTPGSLHFSDDTSEQNLCSMYQRSAAVEKQKFSKESSTYSFSSLQSSSVSSVDCRKPAQREQRAIFPETPSRDPVMNQLKASQQFGREVLDIRDVVKDSMNREGQGLSIKPKVREEVVESILKHTAFDGDYETDVKDSLRVLAKLREASWYSSEPREPSRSSSYHSKDSREASHLSFESLNIPKSNFSSKPSHQDTNARSARPPSVVAKLMGLETLPDSMSLSETKMCSNKTCSLLSNPTRSPSKEPTSNHWNPDLVMKPISRFPIEPAPWRKFDGTQVSKKPAARNSQSLNKPLSSFPSAYSEIEKRFMDLEFTESGNDLRALKQILETMQRKGLLAAQKDCQDSNFTSQSANQRTRGSNSLRHFESSIVIMKPAKLLGKSGTPSSSVIPLDDLSNIPKLQGNEGFRGRNGAATTRVTVKDQNLKTSKRVNTISSTKTNNRTPISPQVSVRSKENNSGSLKTPGFISPRLQQKKLELEKRSRPPTPSSDSKISRRQANKQQMKSSPPGGKHGQKSSNIPQNEEVTSTLQSFEKSSPLAKTVGLLENELLGEPAILAPEYPSPVSVLDNVGYTDESPSPVKHISEALEEDRSEYNAASSTFGYPVTLEINRKKLKKIENLVQKLRRLNSSHDEIHTDYIASICESTDPDHRYVAEILLASGLLLGDLGSSTTTYQFHSSGYPINPELFSVLEQTKESTLGKEECAKENSNKAKEKIHRKLIFDFVNELLAAKLALVGPFSEPWLRPRVAAMKAPNSQKLLRELCAEIEQLQTKPSRCSLDQDEDDEPESWSDFAAETSNIVLSLERLVFKDLVDEIVRGDGNSLRTKPTRQKQLFKK
ncbi:PREDICTED: protein LONGIFOLIA 1-like [Ipomoea nil]|uniref:protein LONGIFOLIA 1-like n=1 Tax=Ipomoea nil TaxID=35883 RepID=UPI000900AE0B|nr:PREDICTED: protein LONGIFOLIA 1-like [Ipomoea nil]XP_019153168.1 PREDICTED: protein LONGIFOLIA 1-like [Ipomoea nil]XP_019153169.1 PREDICTED: protein LONGIFOLIA 1-like [Ipomoea nil]